MKIIPISVGFALLLSACSTVPEQPSQAEEVQTNLSRDAKPSNIDAWISRVLEAYPADLVRRGESGSVGLTVTVGANGRVSACQITQTSGYQALDDAACRSVSRYGRFQPALDPDGNPVSGTWSSIVNYSVD